MVPAGVCGPVSERVGLNSNFSTSLVARVIEKGTLTVVLDWIRPSL